MIINYTQSKIKAVSLKRFQISDDRFALVEIDEDGYVDGDVIDVREGDSFEYMFTCENGDHFVYYGEGKDGFGFWVCQDLVELVDDDTK